MNKKLKIFSYLMTFIFSFELMGITIDSQKSEIKFVVTKFIKNVGDVSMKFKNFSGSYQFDQKTKELSDIIVVIDPNSVDSGDPERDESLKKDEALFNTDKYKEIKFITTPKEKFKLQEGVPTNIKGSLTIKNVTKPVDLSVIAINQKDNFSFKALSTIRRSDFSVNYNKEFNGEKLSKDLLKKFINEGKNKALGENVRVLISIQ